nr:site-2 protease family protein [uncultured Undibacterium sp.]
MDALIQTIAVYAIPVILAITLHEAAHAYAAKFFGDTTAYSQGRMSLNPIVHIDLLGTIILPALLYLSGSGFLFGYAKPVPVNFGALRNPKKNMAWVALAGPMSNLLMAFLWGGVFALLKTLDVKQEFFYLMAQAGLSVNLAMFALNLIPIPPLDGGRIILSLLPNHLAYKFAKIEPYGFFLILGLMFFKLLDVWMEPVIKYAFSVIQWLVL